MGKSKHIEKLEEKRIKTRISRHDCCNYNMRMMSLSLDRLCHSGLKLKHGQQQLFSIILAEKQLTHQLMMQMSDNFELELISMKQQIRQQMRQWMRKQMRQELSEFEHELNCQTREERSLLEERLQYVDNLRDKYDDIKHNRTDEQVLNQKLQALSAEIRECRDELRSKLESSTSELEVSQTEFRNALQHELELQRNQRKKSLDSLHEKMNAEIQLEIKKIGEIQHDSGRVSQDLIIALQEKFNSLEPRFKQEIQTCMAVISEQLAKESKKIGEMFESRIGECEQGLSGARERLDEKGIHMAKLEDDLDKLKIDLSEGLDRSKEEIQREFKEQVTRVQSQGNKEFDKLSKTMNEMQKNSNETGKQIDKLRAFLQKLNDEYQFSTLGPLQNKIKISVTGKSIAKIPPSILKLQSLKQLCLSQNNITELPEDIDNLISLQTLDLNQNKISVLPENICNLSSLWVLNLNQNLITHLPDSIVKLGKLKQLNVIYNQISLLPNDFYLPSLQKFCIYSNKLKQIPETIGKMKQLYYLDFDSNQISELPVCLFDLPLKTLWISNNKFTQIPYQITHLTSLSSLGINQNNIQKLPQWLFQPKKPTNLYANSFQFSLNLQSLVQNSQNLSQPPDLQLLWINEMGLTQLPENFTNLKNLKYLRIQKNNLIRLPKRFGELKQLQKLQLTVSADSEISLETLPISELTALTTLRIEYNKYKSDEETQRFVKLCQSRNIQVRWWVY